MKTTSRPSDGPPVAPCTPVSSVRTTRRFASLRPYTRVDTNDAASCTKRYAAAFAPIAATTTVTVSLSRVSNSRRCRSAGSRYDIIRVIIMTTTTMIIGRRAIASCPRLRRKNGRARRTRAFSFSLDDSSRTRRVPAGERNRTRVVCPRTVLRPIAVRLVLLYRTDSNVKVLNPILADFQADSREKRHPRSR